MKRIFLLLTFFLLYSQIVSASTQEITIMAVGDINPQILANYSQQDLRDLANLFSQADIIIGNLESPLTNYPRMASGKNPRSIREGRDFVFRSDPATAQKLAFLGFTAFNLANNHMMDYCPQGFLETLDTLDKSNLYYFGAGRDCQEAHRPLLLSYQGTLIAFLGYSEIIPCQSLAGKNVPGITSLEFNQIKKDIQNAKKSKAEIIIVSLHWGEELAFHPDYYQKTLAHKIIDAGADLILGHHPHVLQPTEVYQGKTIAYSLGNFIFWSGSSGTQKTQILTITFVKGSKWQQKFQIIPVKIINGLPRLAKHL